jgi:membrane protein required for colicin V production
MENLPINIVDLVFVVVIVVSGLLALYRGFVTELMAVAGWVGAAIITLTFFSTARPLLRDYIPSELASDIATGIVLFLLSLIVISALTHFIARFVRGKRTGVIDRVLGFLFGLLRGYVVLALVYLLFSQVYPPSDRPAWVEGAYSLPTLKFGADTLRRVIPEGAFEEGRALTPRRDVFSLHVLPAAASDSPRSA